MDSIDYNKLLEVTDEQFKQIRKEYNVTKESLNTDIDSLISWYKMQPHLPQITLDRSWVERILISNKCLMERTKLRLESTFTSRIEYPDFYQNRDILKTFQISGNSIIVVPLPKLTPDNKRIIFLKLVNTDSANFSYEHLLQLFILIIEYKQRHDYFMGDIYISDLSGQGLGHYVKYNPLLMKKAEKVLREVYGNRIAAMYIMNGGPILDKIMTLMKAILSPKLTSRIILTPNVEELHKQFTKEILPRDYGGSLEKTTEEIYADLEAEICSEKYLQMIKASEALRSDESKRPVKNNADDKHGVDGSFRKLGVD